MEDDHPDPVWPLDGADAVRTELLAAYDAPTRGYHDRRHLLAVLTRLDRLSAAGVTFDDVPVRLAAWFHDAVYDGERDAEERSATWAEIALPTLVDDATVAEVARLVRLTETHSPEPDDLNGSALCDADLGILAETEAEYDTYAADVREDYRHLSDAAFRSGRIAKLEELVERDELFHTGPAREAWTDAARTNLRRELADLTALDAGSAAPR
ncbi:HD domain-containing protein [Nocardioides sambongensis]|uniref:HD domain-containing protein n=1 Tax=Nocardioides sambongensis TaxID=2589074 RepID=UPI001126BCF6|nr:hypothetical protein [Nocardioides sambongensis]